MHLKPANPYPILAVFGLRMASAVGSIGAAEDPTWDSQPSELGGDLLFGRMSRAGDACIAGRYQIEATESCSRPNSRTFQDQNGVLYGPKLVSLGPTLSPNLHTVAGFRRGVALRKLSEQTSRARETNMDATSRQKAPRRQSPFNSGTFWAPNGFSAEGQVELPRTPRVPPNPQN